ncbi:unnamed protein product [Cuscuta campestris]|uniref:SHSP domain-containing protein n=1 Tax=Cuscuta campestris TaxID=132261 RepID=A0A484KAI7_9ASTE|nr:unnamed protein product [Cuscuta campestris]
MRDPTTTTGLDDGLPRSENVIYEEVVPLFEWNPDSTSHYWLLLHVPGFRREDLRVEVRANGLIRIGGERKVPTPMDKLMPENKKKLSLNAKALNILFCALGQDEFARVSSCKSAKEAWELLEATHEGDKDPKASKIALRTSECENFKMKKEERVPMVKKTMTLKVDDKSESEGESDEELAMFKRYKKVIKWNQSESSRKFPPKKGKHYYKNRF